MSYFGATGTLVLDFWWRLFWVSKPNGFCLICIVTEANVMYIPQGPPLVLHMPTSWWPAAQPFTSPHACAEVGLSLDLNGQSPGQKTNVVPLCQRPGFNQEYLNFILAFDEANQTKSTQQKITEKLDRTYKKSQTPLTFNIIEPFPGRREWWCFWCECLVPEAWHLQPKTDQHYYSDLLGTYTAEMSPYVHTNWIGISLCRLFF